ncbi:response regulator transcription factor [Candidatus Kuenenia sp.]|uniref:response regulator transcription factor n=1 Tax=Candidatus Kuenenia sp. TaxID=2499824 RepID=UPI00322087BF
MNETILIVDDEQDIVNLIMYHLEKDGYKTITALDGETALALSKSEHPALIILDIMLPGMNGLEVCKRLKADEALSGAAIIMLTARGEEGDITLGLKLGADDYVTKPFSPKELVARVHSVLRRTKNASSKKELIEIGDLKINLDNYEVKIGRDLIPLTLTEFKLLCQLAGKPGRVFTRDQLIDAIAGVETIIVDRTIDVHIASLRKKLKSFKNHIITIRGIGYKFMEWQAC